MRADFLAGSLGIAAILTGYSCAYGVDPDGPDLGANATTSGAGNAATGATAAGGASVSSASSSSAAPGSGGATGTGGAGTGGAGTGAVGGGGGAASSVGSGGAPVGLVVEYKCAFTDVGGNQIKAVFNVKNNSSADVALSDLEIRYYYTIDAGATTQSFYCDYAQLGCGIVQGTFGMASGANTDHYLAVGFTGAGTLAPGAQSGEVQSRFNKTDYSVCVQTNDYSFDPTKTAFVPWDHVTLYHQGALAWGVEP